MRRASAALMGLSLAACSLAGCSLAPPYQPPPTPPIAAYKESAGWTPARPADVLPRDGWWRIFNDPTLDRLEQQAAEQSPTLAQAQARYQQAHAYLDIARAGLLPQASVNASTSRNRQSDNRPLRGSNQPDEYDADTVGLQIGYEIDLWGRVRNAVAAQAASAQASDADLAAARLSLQADLADAYVRLRGLDTQGDLLDRTIAAYDRTYNLSQKRHAQGLASQLDVARAQTQLQTAKAQAANTAARRAVLEHAIASLVGQPASTFTLAADPHLPPVANPPVVVPSVLLQRRPDVAAAERRMAAANARIGVAKAAFFPTLGIDASAGYQNTGGGDLIGAPNSFWGVGPALAAFVFDGGRRKAGAKAARAEFDQAAAFYRGRVLRAFQDVEDSLSTQRDLEIEAQAQASAAQGADTAETLATKQYNGGAISSLELVTAQTAALRARQAMVEVNVEQAQAGIRLVRAIGGGWSAGS